MTQEAYVTFEVAKLLRDKGFDTPSYITGHVYSEHGTLQSNTSFKSVTMDYITACTQQMAMKWLREMHNLCIEPYRTSCGYLYTISTIPYGSCKCNPKKGGDDEYCGQWTTWEKACEDGIKYCLENLI